MSIVYTGLVLCCALSEAMLSKESFDVWGSLNISNVSGCICEEFQRVPLRISICYIY